MKSRLEIDFSGFFGDKGIYFNGDVVTGTLLMENFQHISVNGKIFASRIVAIYFVSSEEIRDL